MRRWGLGLWLVLTWSGVALAGEKAAVSLDIPARAQAPERPDEGWCAETAIQESMLHFGAFVPQRQINRAGKPRNPDLYWGDIPRALRALGVRSTTWSGRGGQKAFTRWVRDQLRRGHPVIAGVKLYPTAQPGWGLDHIVLITGVDADGAMRINTTWGYQTRRTAAELAQTKRGMSLTNRYGRQFARAVTGLSRAAGPRVKLEVGRPKRGEIAATARISGLARGRRYELLRDGKLVERFRASGSTATRSVAIPADRASRIEVRP